MSSEVQDITNYCIEMSKVKTKGELGTLIVSRLHKYSPFDLSMISAKLNEEIKLLPSPYREQVKPYFDEQLFGGYHSILLKYNKKELSGNFSPITDPDLFQDFCKMIPDGCDNRDEEKFSTSFRIWLPKYRLFYFLIAVYTMFVCDKPGHPVGMPFPGSIKIIQKGDTVLCPIRDKEKDVLFSVCNFCPAEQDPEFR